MPAAGFPISWIRIGGLNRVGFSKTLRSLWELPSSVLASAKLLEADRPAAVFSTGGYAAGPVLLAALWKRIPIVILEPNAVPGFTHRKLARFVSRALVSFESATKWFPPGRAEVTGLPVREEFFQVPDKPVSVPLTVLITGGSQGSRTLNRAAQESWPMWDKQAIRLIHQTGRAAYDDFAPRFRSSGIAGEITPFLEDMPATFVQAGLVVTRCGMGAVSELAAAGKPAILVPFPGASDQHQLRNAEAFALAGAGVLVLDREMNGARLVDEVTKLIAHPERLRDMASAARSFARRGAAERAATILEEFSAG